MEDDQKFGSLRFTMMVILLLLISIGIHGALEAKQIESLDQRVQALESSHP
jgi:hypothetical protein